MPTMSSGRFFAETLRGHGITHVFIVPAIFQEAMVAMEDAGITRVTAHHEVAAAFMADGYARASRGPGVCLAQSVGAANLAAGLRDAFLASSPVIALTGGPHPDSRYRYLYQVIEDFPMFDPVTKFNGRVDRPGRLPDLLRQAFRVATTGSPGPVHLELPGRVGEGVQGEGEYEVIVESRFSRYPPYRMEPDMALVREAAGVLASAQRPVLVAGGGVTASDAGAELVRLAETLSVPVATSFNGKGTIPENHPLSAGVLGAYGRPCTRRVVEEADLVVLVGSRAGGFTTSNWKAPRPDQAIVQVDIDPQEIGRNYPVKAGVVGDAKVVLRRLAEVVEPTSRAGWTARVQALVAEWRASVASVLDSDAVPIHPARVCREITEFLPRDAVLLSDTGFAAAWTGTMIELRHPTQRYIRCAGTLGWAFPASLGVKCALPDRPVLSFTGDGGFFYHLSELETAARLGINAVVLVNNNRALRQLKRNLDRAYGGTQWGRSHEIWVFKEGTNFARIAEEMGCLGIRVEHPDEIRGALEQAVAAGRPTVVDLVTDIEASPSISA